MRNGRLAKGSLALARVSPCKGQSLFHLPASEDTAVTGARLSGSPGSEVAAS